MAPNGAVKTCDLHSLLPRLTLPCYKNVGCGRFIATPSDGIPI